MIEFLQGWFALSLAVSGFVMMLSFGFMVLVGGGMLVCALLAGLRSLLRRKP